jgi:hypothetical protein
MRENSKIIKNMEKNEMNNEKYFFRNFCEENMHFYAFITIFYGMNFKSKCMHENVA